MYIHVNLHETLYMNLSAHTSEFINPRRACARVTVLGLCVCLCVCVSVCPAPRVLPLRATERPTEGTYGLGASWKTF